MGRSITVAARPFRCVDKGGGQEGGIKPHVHDTSRVTVSSTPACSANRNSVRSSNKHQIHISAPPLRSIKRTSVSFANKQQSQIFFISSSKARTKQTLSSTIRRNIQIIPLPVGEQPEQSQAQEVPSLIFHGVICLLPFLWGRFPKRGFSKSCNYPVFLLSDAAIVCYL